MDSEEFKVMGAKWIFYGKKLLAIVDPPVYAETLAAKLNLLQKSSSSEYATAVLAKITEKGTIAKPFFNNNTSSKASEEAVSNVSKKTEQLGNKILCAQCKTNWYNLGGKITQCPKCSKSNNNISIN